MSCPFVLAFSADSTRNDHYVFAAISREFSSQSDSSNMYKFKNSPTYFK